MLGDAGSKLLGDGSSDQLARPVHLAAFDGADLISSEGGITCARTAERELRCFGRLGSAAIDPTLRIPLPEPIDRMVGAYPLCVRGTTTQTWYCRDPFTAFFRGTLPGGWSKVVDERGKPLGTNVIDMATDSGRGVLALTRDGALHVFFFSGVVKPLRLAPFKGRGHSGNVAAVSNFETWILRDGTAHQIDIDDSSAAERVLPAPLKQVAHQCFVTPTGSLGCVDKNGPVTFAEHVASIRGYFDALTDDGRVLTRDPAEKIPAFHEVKGLPTMAQVGEGCGLSVDKQVWCWGRIEQTDAPTYRLEPMPVAH